MTANKQKDFRAGKVVVAPIRKRNSLSHTLAKYFGVTFCPSH